MSDIGVLVTLDEESAKTSLTLDYTSRDFTSIRAQLIGLASGILPEWNTNGESADFGTLILELFAYMGDTLNFYIDRTASEAFLSTAVREQSVLYIADMLGYKPMGQHAASVTLYFSMATQAGETQLPPVKIPKGTRIHNQAENAELLVVFETQEDITVKPGDGMESNPPIKCFATEGITRRDVSLGTAYGAPNTNFALPDAGVVYGTVEIYAVEGFSTVKWTFISDLSLARPTQPVFTTYSDEQNITYVVFGDNAVGRIPSVNSDIFANYRYGVGAAANLVQPDGLTTIVPPPNTDITDVSVRNDISPLGGSDPETVESMKYSIPRSGARIRNRAVTLNDYADLAMQVPGVSKSVSYGTVYTSVNVLIGPSTVDGTLDDGGMSVLCKEVAQYMGDKILIGSQVFVGPDTTDDLWTDVYIRVNVHVTETYNRTAVREQVDAVLRKYLSYDVVDFGTRISMGDVYRTILTVAGVAWADLRWLSTSVPTIDYPGAITSTPTAGGVTTVRLKSAWQFDTTVTMADPGTNHYRLNNATAPTILAINKTDQNGVNQTAVLNQLLIGDHIVIQRSTADPMSWWDLTIISTPVLTANWYQMNVRSTPSSVALPPADDEVVGLEMVSYSPTPESSGDVADVETNELKIPRIEPTEIIEGSDALQEVQRLTPTVALTAGTFTLTLLGSTTAAIQWNANSGAIQAAIDLVAPNKVTVTGAGTINTSAMTLTYTDYANVAQVVVNASLTGTLTPSTITEGVTGPWVDTGMTEDERTHDGLWVTADGGLVNS